MSIFICPKCGFKDASCWRASRFMLYTITCKIDELQVCEPKIAKELIASGVRLELGPYVYRLVEKSGRVYRSTKEMEGEYKRGHWTEKPKDPFQRKLLEVSK